MGFELQFDNQKNSYTEQETEITIAGKESVRQERWLTRAIFRTGSNGKTARQSSMDNKQRFRELDRTGREREKQRERKEGQYMRETYRQMDRQIHTYGTYLGRYVGGEKQNSRRRRR